MTKKRSSKLELNEAFLRGLGSYVKWHSDIDSVPLLIDMRALTGEGYKLRVYLFNLTNPPGGRALDEYKAQIILPGQKKKEKAHFDYSDGRMPLLVAYTQEGKDEIFVFWDAYKHEGSSFSANIQVKADTIIEALYKDCVCSKRNNNEVIVAARSQNVHKAIKERINIMLNEVLEE